MRRIRRALLATVFGALMVCGTMTPALAAGVASRSCTTITRDIGTAYQVKVCVSVYEADDNAKSVKGYVQFCFDGDAWPCEATSMEVDYLQLRTDVCSDGQGWYEAERRNDYSFGLAATTATATQWHSDLSPYGAYYRTNFRFRLKWPNGAWSGYYFRDSNLNYQSGIASDPPGYYNC